MSRRSCQVSAELDERAFDLNASCFRRHANNIDAAAAAGMVLERGYSVQIAVKVSETLSALRVSRSDKQRRKAQEAINIRGVLENAGEVFSREV